MPDGRYKHFMGATVAEATAKYEEAYQQATLEESKNNGGATFREMAIAYKDYITGSTKPVKRGTINAYIKNIPPLLECFGDTPMADIDTQAVCGYMERMKMDGKALHTIHQCKKRAVLYLYLLVRKLSRYQQSGSSGKTTRRDEKREASRADKSAAGYY